MQIFPLLCFEEAEKSHFRYLLAPELSTAPMLIRECVLIPELKVHVD